MDRRKSLAKSFAVHGKKDDEKQDSDVFLSELISHRPQPKVEDAMNMAGTNMNMMGAPMQVAYSTGKDHMQETADKLKKDATGVLQQADII